MKSLNKIFPLLSMLLLIFAFNASAQRPDGSRMTAEKENELIFSKIDGLTDKQKEKIKSINEDFVSGSKTLFESFDGDREGMREKRKVLMEEKSKALQNVFTENQFAKYTLLMEERRNERRGKRKKRDSSDTR